MRFRRAKAILAYWREGRLCFDNYLTRVSVAADQTTLQILNFFDRWRRPDELCALFPEYTPASVRHAVQQLATHTLLVREGTPQAKQDAHVAKVWSRWLPEGSFHFATKDAQYINPEWGLAYLKSILPKTPQPAFFKSYRNAAHVDLPPRELPDSEFLRVLMTRRTQREFSSKKLPLEALSQLLSLTWGVTGYRATPLFGNLPLKTSPSGGARTRERFTWWPCAWKDWPRVCTTIIPCTIGWKQSAKAQCRAERFAIAPARSTRKMRPLSSS